MECGAKRLRIGSSIERLGVVADKIGGVRAHRKLVTTGDTTAIKTV
jgi:hypothetical protein